MNEIYQIFGMEWPPAQPEPQVTVADGETAATATATDEKPGTPKLDQAREKSLLDKSPSDIAVEEVKVSYTT